MQKYTGYTAQIYEGEESGDRASAEQKGEDMKSQFRGADYHLIAGKPWGQCQSVEGGKDAAVRNEIKEWINSR